MQSPYKFLDFFGKGDQSIFFGRDREINILVADIVVNRLVVLFARSGTGKTSLINAGVRPKLEARGFETFYIRVEQDPTAAARAVLKEQGLLDHQSADLPLSRQLCAVVEERQKPIVLFFDQFEEFFIQIRDQETRRNFITDIAETYQDANSGVYLVFSMREEYFHEMDEFRTEIPSIFHRNSNLRLLPLDKEQAKKAIVEPARTQGVDVEPELVVTLIEDLAQDGHVPPTSLQIICDTLWQYENGESKRIKLQDYQRLGGVQPILDQRLERDIERQITDPNQLALLQKLIPELRTERDTKYPRLLSDLVRTLYTDDESLAALVDRLKSIYVLKEITVSGARGIEWTSDYLAERTDYLLWRVKAIELKQLLRLSMDQASQARAEIAAKPGSANEYISEEHLKLLYLPPEVFERLSTDFQYLGSLDPEPAAFMLDAALFHRRWMRIWFDTNLKAHWDLLQIRIQDRNLPINLRLGAVGLLGEIGSDQAVQLLGEALNQPDLALEVVEILVDVPGQQATLLLSKALEREDLWEATLISLTRSPSERAVTLLEPLLSRDVTFFTAFGLLERLSKTSGAIGQMAKQEFEAAIPRLGVILTQGDTFAQIKARSSLESLMKHSSELVRALAQKVLRDAEAAKGVDAGVSVQGSIIGTVVQGNVIYYNTSPEENVQIKGMVSYSDREWDRILAFIARGRFLPILSNSFRLEQIFRPNPASGDTASADNLAVTEQLTREWANLIEYPLPGDTDLARVAQYHLVEERDHIWAKMDYINFLKDKLLKDLEGKEEYGATVREIRTQKREIEFAELTHQLGVPVFPPDRPDPLDLLARLPLPIFLTTSYHTFLEGALERQGRKPNSIVCDWKRMQEIAKGERYASLDFEPSIEQPLVYHWFGLERTPESLVLSEDDYLEFLLKVSGDTDTLSPLIPVAVRAALARSQILLLGYRSEEWDFRILLNLLKQYRAKEPSARGLMVQPVLSKAKTAERTLEYFKHYFDINRISFEADEPEEFVYRLWDAWSRYSR